MPCSSASGLCGAFGLVDHEQAQQLRPREACALQQIAFIGAARVRIREQHIDVVTRDELHGFVLVASPQHFDILRQQCEEGADALDGGRGFYNEDAGTHDLRRLFGSQSGERVGKLFQMRRLAVFQAQVVEVDHP